MIPLGFPTPAFTRGRGVCWGFFPPSRAACDVRDALAVPHAPLGRAYAPAAMEERITDGDDPAGAGELSVRRAALGLCACVCVRVSPRSPVGVAAHPPARPAVPTPAVGGWGGDAVPRPPAVTLEGTACPRLRHPSGTAG